MSQANIPEIKIKLTNIDKFVEVIALVATLLVIIIPLWHYSILPERIPIKFGSDGIANNYGGKASIFILPIIHIFLYLGLTGLNFLPHLFNYTREITEANASVQYKMAIQLMRNIKCIMALAFSFLSYKIVQSAINEQSNMPIAFPIMLVAVLFATIGLYFYKASK